jgi:hypothetical protein
MFFVVVAHSEDVDTDSALTEILDQCQEDLAGRTPKVGDSIVVGGFYGYGEISPRIGKSKTKFHNETFVTLLLGT